MAHPQPLSPSHSHTPSHATSISPFAPPSPRHAEAFTPSAIPSPSSSHSGMRAFAPRLSDLSLRESMAADAAIVDAHVSSLPAHQRQIARKALLAVGGRAQRLIDNTRGSNALMRYSIDTVSRSMSYVPGTTALRSLAVNQWSAYGDPLLNKIDAKLDEAVNAIANATTGLQLAYEFTQAQSSPPSQPLSLIEPRPELDEDATNNDRALIPLTGSHGTYVDYWSRLKDKFVSSHWYRHVDAILLQNSVVQAFTHRMIRPAEVFFNTVTEEFLSHQSQEDFLSALKARVGPAWDERLAPLAKGFYTTAKAVSAVVGAGKFVGGALQLGRVKVNNVVEELLEQWDRVLGLGNNLVDRWLPDSDTAAAQQAAQSQKQLMESDEAFQSTQTNTRIGGKRRFRHEPKPAPLDSDDDSDDYDSLSENEEMIVNGVGSLTVARLQSRRKHLKPHYESMVSATINGNGDCIDDDDSLSDDSLSDDDDIVLSTSLTPLSSNTMVDRSGQMLIGKVGARLRQRIPSMSLSSSMQGLSAMTTTFTSELKQRLTDSAWFTLVDDILMQNAFVKALAAVVRPAEHFFNTSVQLFHIYTTQHPTAALALPSASAVAAESVPAGDDTADDEQMEEEQASAELPSLDTNIPTPTVPISAAASVHQSTIATSRPSVTSSIASSPSAISPPQTQSFLPRIIPPSPSTFSQLSASLSPSDSLPLDDTADDFVFQLRAALGGSWDDRLYQHARSFYQTAQEVRPKDLARA